MFGQIEKNYIGRDEAKNILLLYEDGKSNSEILKEVLNATKNIVN